jgi:hypothetical protein
MARGVNGSCGEKLREALQDRRKGNLESRDQVSDDPDVEAEIAEERWWECEKGEEPAVDIWVFISGALVSVPLASAPSGSWDTNAEVSEVWALELDYMSTSISRRLVLYLSSEKNTLGLAEGLLVLRICAMLRTAEIIA